MSRSARHGVCVAGVLAVWATTAYGAALAILEPERSMVQALAYALVVAPLITWLLLMSEPVRRWVDSGH